MDWECGGRDKATCERLLERLAEIEAALAPDLADRDAAVGGERP